MQCLAEDTLRPEWVWRATEDDGRIVASHYWWARAGAAAPSSFVSIIRGDVDAAAAPVRHSRDALGLQLARTALTASVADERDIDVIHPE